MMLVTLYLLMDYIMLILTIWVTCGTTVGLAVVIQEATSHMKCIFKNGPDQQDKLARIKVPIIGEFNLFDVACFALASTVSIGWFITKNWLLNNILGASMCFLFLKTLRLNKLVPGVLLLSLLFFYDIFWVFYSQKFTKGG